MYLKHLELRDYRSWKTLSADFTPGIIVLTGRNGHGKTNIVEAIGYAAHLASHRVSQDAALVRVGQDNARISATVENDGRQLTAHLLIKSRGSNMAQLNRTRLSSPRELLGVVKTVLFAPEDLQLIKGDPATRRRFLDEIICSIKPRLSGVKADYDKIVRQRNALLKSSYKELKSAWRAPDTADEVASSLTTLDVWDDKLASLGAQLIAERFALVDELNPLMARTYATIAPESQPASLSYVSTVPGCSATSTQEEIHALLSDALVQGRGRDIERGLSLIGPHRDDCEISLSSTPAKGFASHGETWSLALSLRLATYSLYEKMGSTPILILDDVFAELDAKRRVRLVHEAMKAEQVFITAAVGDDLPENLAEAQVMTHTVVAHDTDEGKISVFDEK